jgi:hypothetical protein
VSTHRIDVVAPPHVSRPPLLARRGRAPLLVALCIVALLGAVALQAQAEGKAKADPALAAAAAALFDEALRLMNEGRFAEACPKLEESQKLESAVGTLLYLGNCYEQTRRTASAWASYRAAAEAARSEGQPEREKRALERAVALETLFARIVVVVPPEARMAGLMVKRDGAVLGEASWGVGVPVDPGSHLVEASAPGKKPFSRAVRLPATSATVTVTVPKLEDAGAGAGGPIASAQAMLGVGSAQGSRMPSVEPNGAPGGADGTGRQGSGPAVGEAASSDAGNAQRIAGAVIGGTGLVGLVVGIVYGVRASSLESDSEAYCLPPDYTMCTDEGLALLDEASTAGVVSTVSFVAGGVLAAGGLVLILTAPTDPDPPGSSVGTQARCEIVPLVGPRASGLVLRGAW